jgi:hypothetical protein
MLGDDAGVCGENIAVGYTSVQVEWSKRWMYLSSSWGTLTACLVGRYGFRREVMVGGEERRVVMGALFIWCLFGTRSLLCHFVTLVTRRSRGREVAS